MLAVKDDTFVATLRGRSYLLAPVEPRKFIVPDNPAGMTVELAAAEKGKPARARMTIGTSQEYRSDMFVEVIYLGSISGRL